MSKSERNARRKKRKADNQAKVNAWLEEWNTASSERKRMIEQEIFSNYTPQNDNPIHLKDL